MYCSQLAMVADFGGKLIISDDCVKLIKCVIVCDLRQLISDQQQTHSQSVHLMKNIYISAGCDFFWRSWENASSLSTMTPK